MTSAAKTRGKRTARKSRTYAKERHHGVISATEAYSFRELFERFGFGRKWMSEARLNGLKTVPLGRQRGVRGEELLRFLKTQES